MRAAAGAASLAVIRGRALRAAAAPGRALRGVSLGLALLFGTTGPAKGLEKPERVVPGESPARTLALRVKRLGARAVIQEIFDKPVWADVKAGIASADPAWLEVGDDLRAAAEGDAAGELDLAFAEAIGRDPERVLDYARGLDDPDAFADLCGALPSDAPVPQCRRALERRRRALLKVPESRWREQAEACRAAIDSAASGLDEEEAEGE